MRRRGLWICGLALGVLCCASAVCAQEGPAIPRFLGDIQAEPKQEIPAPKVEVNISPNTGMPRQEGTAEKFVPISELALQSSEYIDIRYVANSQYPDDLGIWERTRMGYGDQIRRTFLDLRNFYLTDNLFYVGAAVAIAAPLANTHADIGIRDWYQRRVGGGRSRGLDYTADTFAHFGDYWYAIPIYLTCSMSENLFPDSPMAATAAEFGNRSIRAMIVGAPTVGVLQVGLGAERPPQGRSSWRPFTAANSVAGHGFIGAIPFMTAASMTESRMLKALLYTGSLAPVWSRIHEDRHYFSQAFLGWSIAFLSVQAVNNTENPDRNWSVVPIDIPNGVGMGVQVKY